MRNTICKLAVSFLLVSSLTSPAIPIKAESDEEIIVKASTVNVRKGPGLSYPIVQQLQKGDSCEVINQQGDWIEISSGAGQSGWVANWLVQKDDASKEERTKEGTAETDNLRIRSGPGMDFQITGSLKKGVTFQVMKQNESWVKIQYGDKEGWVSSEFVSFKKVKDEKKKKQKKTNSKKGVISAELLNVRTEPKKSSTLAGKLAKNTEVKVYSKKGDWIEIEFKGESGWVREEYIVIKNNDDSKKKNESDTLATVTASALSVRKEPSLDGRIVARIHEGEKYTILKEKGNWVQIEIAKGETGWAADWYLKKTDKKPSESKIELKDSKVHVIHNGTNFRSSSGGSSPIVYSGNAGESFPILSLDGNWYKVKLEDGSPAYVAGWIVTVSGDAPQLEKAGIQKYLSNKVIVIDPGHGGRDNGTTGTMGTLEKNLTYRTARLLQDKLNAAGATAILTREGDSYASLPARVGTSHFREADAFISIHYDGAKDKSARGVTTYYYHAFQKDLASDIHNSLTAQINLKDRGYRFGDYHVIRENKRKAILLELGYLSNSAEEMTITSSSYQETVSGAIFTGLARHFKANM
ncbi:N-acetylmuramoyl-L-alanine amidase [Peribacillus saganii]|uniref:N-acetylmuramoyl-L-alanine amidase n=1 Tax=Peribacillus saganii TaxID=2303992 RepID=A0A372LVM6_9BACI|nr:SH3 domain-containing protein [Peribacillus saganii]RFU71614.1 N-acetylmuramoyl-L-alanine amidase [Peribacillus saganii]